MSLLATLHYPQPMKKEPGRVAYVRASPHLEDLAEPLPDIVPLMCSDLAQVLADQDQNLAQVPKVGAQRRVEVDQLEPAFFFERELVFEDEERRRGSEDVVWLGVSRPIGIFILNPLPRAERKLGNKSSSEAVKIPAELPLIGQALRNRP